MQSEKEIIFSTYNHNPNPYPPSSLPILTHPYPHPPSPLPMSFCKEKDVI